MGLRSVQLLLLATVASFSGSAAGRPPATCRCKGDDCVRKARRLMVEHGFTGKEAADQVKHAGDPGNLNRWFRNHKPAVDGASTQW